MTISWILFAVMNAVAKYACGYTAFTVVLFFQHGIAFLLLSPLLFSSGFSLLDTENKGLLGLRALGGLLVFICLFFALSLIPLTDALLLANTGPLFLPFILLLWLKQKTSGKIWLSASVGFIGVLLIMQPSSQIFHFGSLFALLAGCFTGFVMIIVRRLASENSKRVVLSYLLMATAASLPFACPFFPLIPMKAIPSLLLVGTLFAIGQWTYTRALIHAYSAILAPFSYVFIVVGVGIDWFIWNRYPSLGTLTGILLIVAGGILTILWSRKVPRASPKVENPLPKM